MGEVGRDVDGSRVRALVVDDDRDIAELVQMALSEEGYEVVLAPNGAAALNASRSQLFDIILLDMRMPVMDGWTFARSYREQPGPHAPMIVVTAARDASTRAAEIDADGYLAKPFSLAELFDIVGRHVRRSLA
ncbi:MAG: response regulator transcription factor [Chloroflexota bacterium]